MLINRVQIPTKNFSSFWSFVRDVGHCMNMVLDRRKPVLGSQQWLQQSYVIAKCDSFFITKSDKNLSQNMSGSFLQNATISLQNAMFISK